MLVEGRHFAKARTEHRRKSGDERERPRGHLTFRGRGHQRPTVRWSSSTKPGTCWPQRRAASLISPFVGRLDDNQPGRHDRDPRAGRDGSRSTRSSRKCWRLLSATRSNVTQAALAGAHVATIPFKDPEADGFTTVTDKGIAHSRRTGTRLARRLQQRRRSSLTPLRRRLAVVRQRRVPGPPRPASARVFASRLDSARAADPVRRPLRSVWGRRSDNPHAPVRTATDRRQCGSATGALLWRSSGAVARRVARGARELSRPRGNPRGDETRSSTLGSRAFRWELRSRSSFWGPLAVAVLGFEALAGSHLGGPGRLGHLHPRRRSAHADDAIGVAAVFAAASVGLYISSVGGRLASYWPDGRGLTLAMVVCGGAGTARSACGLGCAAAPRKRPSLWQAAWSLPCSSSAIPYTAEIAALRRLPAATFGVLMSLEPAIAAGVGFILLARRSTRQIS